MSRLNRDKNREPLRGLKKNKPADESSEETESPQETGETGETEEAEESKESKEKRPPLARGRLQGRGVPAKKSETPEPKAEEEAEGEDTEGGGSVEKKRTFSRGRIPRKAEAPVEKRRGFGLGRLLGGGGNKGGAVPPKEVEATAEVAEKDVKSGASEDSKKGVEKKEGLKKGLGGKAGSPRVGGGGVAPGRFNKWDTKKAREERGKKQEVAKKEEALVLPQAKAPASAPSSSHLKAQESSKVTEAPNPKALVTPARKAVTETKVEKVGETRMCQYKHCKVSFGSKFKDVTRLRCECGFMNVIKPDRSTPTPYEVLGVHTDDSIAACRNSWNRVQKKYPFYREPVAHWQAHEAFYELRGNIVRNLTLFEIPGGVGCLACAPFKSIALSHCLVCQNSLQAPLSTAEQERSRKALSSKLAEMEWGDLLEAVQEYVKAEEFLLQGKKEEAEKILGKLFERYRKEESESGPLFELFYGVTQALVRSRSSLDTFSNKEIKAFHQILLVRPKDIPTLLLCSIFALAEGELEEALHYLDVLLEEEYESSYLLAGLGRFLTKRYVEAMEPLLLQEEDPVAQFLLARVQVALGDLESAENVYQSLSRNQHDFVALYHYACFLGNSGKYEDALPYVESCQELRPTEIRPKIMEGHLFALLKEYEKAERTYQALKESPAKKEALVSLAKLAALRKDYQKGISYIEEALREDPNYFSALLALGKLWELEEDLEKAQTYYSIAMTKGDLEGEGLANMGLVSLKLKQKEKARRYLAEAFKVGNRSHACLIALGLLYVEFKDYVSAKMVWQELYDLTQNPEVSKNLACLHYLIAKFEVRHGQYYRAIKNIQLVMKYNPEIEGMEKILSEVFFRLGTQEMYYEFLDGQRPRKFFNFARKFQDKNPYILYYLGYVLLQMKLPSKALGCFQKAYQIKPDPRFIRQVCLTRLHLQDESAKKLLLEIPVNPHSVENQKSSLWIELTSYICFENWDKAIYLLRYFIQNSGTYQLTLKELLKLRILLIRLLYQKDESEGSDRLEETLDQLFTGADADHMQALFLLLDHELEESQEILHTLYQATKDPQILETYRYLFAILITKSKLKAEDPQKIIEEAKKELQDDPEVFHWELSAALEEEELPAYSLLLNTFQASAALPSPSSEDPELKGLEAPYPGLISGKELISLEKEQLKIGTDIKCDIVLASSDKTLYELQYFKEAGKFHLSTTPKGGKPFILNGKDSHQSYLTHRDEIILQDKSFVFLQKRDPTLIYGDVAYGIKWADDWKFLFTDLREVPPENDFSKLNFSNISLSRLSSLTREEQSSLEFHFE